jgi:hypothetical protein
MLNLHFALMRTIADCSLKVVRKVPFRLFIFLYSSICHATEANIASEKSGKKLTL